MFGVKMVLENRNTTIAVIVKDGKVLAGMCPRDNEKGEGLTKKPTYKMPQGGMDDGEALVQAIARELKEELEYNLDIENYKELGEIIPYYFRDEKNVPKYEIRLHQVLISYAGNSSDFIFDPSEFESVEFIDPAEFIEMDLGIRRTAYLTILKKFNLL